MREAPTAGSSWMPSARLMPSKMLPRPSRLLPLGRPLRALPSPFGSGSGPMLPAHCRLAVHGKHVASACEGWRLADARWCTHIASRHPRWDTPGPPTSHGIYPLVMSTDCYWTWPYKSWIFLFKIVMFHNYVKLPEGIYIYIWLYLLIWVITMSRGKFTIYKVYMGWWMGFISIVYTDCTSTYTFW